MGLKILGNEFMTARLQTNEVLFEQSGSFFFYSENFERKSQGEILLNLKWVEFGNTLADTSDFQSQ